MHRNYFLIFAIGVVLLVGFIFAGRFFPAPPPPRISVLTPATPTHNFGTLLVYQTAASPNLSWTSTSNANLNIDGANALGDQAHDPFRLGLVPAPYVLAAAGATTAYTVSFQPRQSGNFTGSTSPNVKNFNLGYATPTQLQGRAVHQRAVGDIVIYDGDLRNDAALDFGSVTVPGGTPTTRSFKLRNTGNATHTLNISWSGAGGTEFTKNAPAGAQIVLAPNQRITVSLRFAPTTVGNMVGTVTFSDAANPTGHLAATTLVGSGVSPGTAPADGSGNGTDGADGSGSDTPPVNEDGTDDDGG